MCRILVKVSLCRQCGGGGATAEWVSMLSVPAVWHPDTWGGGGDLITIMGTAAVKHWAPEDILHNFCFKSGHHWVSLRRHWADYLTGGNVVAELRPTFPECVASSARSHASSADHWSWPAPATRTPAASCSRAVEREPLRRFTLTV